MSPERMLFLTLVFGIPLACLVWPWGLRRPGARVWVQMLVSVLGVWIAVIALRLYTLEGTIQEIRDRGHSPDYDGVAENGATIFLGWLLGLIGTVPALGIGATVEGVQRWRRRRKAVEVEMGE